MGYSKTYKGTFKPKNKGKYKGDHTKIVFRSLWERNTFRFLDENPNVIRWNSEEMIVPYRCKTDNKIHRYFCDIWFETLRGEYLIEIKPKSQTQPPKEPKRKTKRYLNECLTYIKNQSKWEAAEAFAKQKGMKFEIWHEEKLRAMGIKILKG